MTSGVGPGRPPAASRFRKGESGNRKGRPRGAVLCPVCLRHRNRSNPYRYAERKTARGHGRGGPPAQNLPRCHCGQPRRPAGSAEDDRQAREVAGFEKTEAAPGPRVADRADGSRNADGALLLLGIAEPDTRWNDPHDRYEHLLLRPWAVQAALSRPGRRRLSAQDVSEIKRCTREPDTLRWPARTKNEQDE